MAYHMEYCSNGVDSRDIAYIQISAVTMMIYSSEYAPDKELTVVRFTLAPPSNKTITICLCPF